MSSRYSFDALESEYLDLWASIQIRPESRSSVAWNANKILQDRARYEDIQGLTGVPWFVIGLIHLLESGGDFSTHLHNGDSLARRTVQVPANRPASHHGPFKWEESAIDALDYDGVTAVRSWTPARVAHVMEKYNGFGYRRSNINKPSPYLWSFTTHYRVGKFTSDGHYDPDAVSKQAGAMAVLKYLTETQPDILSEFRPVSAPETRDSPIVDITPEDYPKAPEGRPVRDALTNSGTIWGLLVSFFGWLLSLFESFVSFIVESAAKTSEWSGAIHSTMTALGFSTAGAAFSLAIGGLVYAGLRRLQAAQNGKIG